MRSNLNPKANSHTAALTRSRKMSSIAVIDKPFRLRLCGVYFNAPRKTHRRLQGDLNT